MIQTKHDIDLQVEVPLMEDFYSIQGEGYHTGKAAYFVRLAGCDVGCVWCDVKESWNQGDHPIESISTISDRINKSDAEIIVLTGGEPLMYDLNALTEAMHMTGKAVHLETSGAYPLSGAFDWVCISPKKFKRPLAENMYAADELKVVVYHPSDLEWAEEHARMVRPKCKLYLQPEWSKRDNMMPQIIEFVQHNPHWRISLQTHKYIGVR